MLGGEACLVDMPAAAQPEVMPDPGPDLPVEPPRAPAPARAAAVVEDHSPALVPAMTDEDVEVECPRCSYCVLGGDWECGQCGLARMTHPAQPDVSAGEVEGVRRLKSALKRPGGAKNEARIAFADSVAVISIVTHRRDELWWRPEELKNVPPKLRPPTRSRNARPLTTPGEAGSSGDGQGGTATCLSQTGAVNGCEGLSLHGYGASHVADLPVWHGGTLVPPPSMEEFFRPNGPAPKKSRRSQPKELTPEQEERIEANRQAARARCAVRKRKHLERLDGYGETPNPAAESGPQGDSRSSLDEPEGPDLQELDPGQAEEQALGRATVADLADARPSRAPSQAELRLEAMRRRVRARIHAAKIVLCHYLISWRVDSWRQRCHRGENILILLI